MGDLTKNVSKGTVTGGTSNANCTLAYTHAGVQHVFRLRCIRISHGITMLGDESHSRLHRAFYPRQVVPSQFAITFALKAKPNLPRHKYVTVKGKRVPNIGEYERFNAWMGDYMAALLFEDDNPTAQQNFVKMKVSCPARNFFREGVALGPIEFGDHVGSMLWMQTITFETTRLPGDTDPGISKFNAAFTPLDKDANYFYPNSPQLNGQDAPLVFDTVQTIVQKDAVPNQPDPKQVQAATDGDAGSEN